MSLRQMSIFALDGIALALVFWFPIAGWLLLGTQFARNTKLIIIWLLIGDIIPCVFALVWLVMRYPTSTFFGYYAFKRQYLALTISILGIVEAIYYSWRD